MVANVKSYWSGGVLYFTDLSGNVIFTVDGPNRKVTYPSGSTVDTSAATVTQGATLGKGTIPLSLSSWRGLVTNDVPAKAIASGGAGILGKDTTPILERVNGATDTALRISWAASDVTEITNSFIYPADLDQTAAIVFNALVYKNTNTDTGLVVALKYFEDVGGSNLGGNTAAITATALTAISKSVTPATGKNMATVSLVPGTHGTDALYLLGTWITYSRKTS